MRNLRSQIRNAEVEGLSDTLTRLFNADLKAQTDAFLNATMAELETLSEKITTAILQDKTLSTLDAADSARDEAIKTLGTVLAAYAVFPIASKKELAAPLKAVWDKYAKAGITTANYTSESSLVESILQDFSADSLAENIANLEGVAEAITAIRAAQDEFTKANDEYVKASANKGASASSYNKPIVSLINDKLVPYLTVAAMVKPAVYEDFANKIGVSIAKLNASISQRKK